MALQPLVEDPGGDLELLLCLSLLGKPSDLVLPMSSVPSSRECSQAGVEGVPDILQPLLGDLI